MDPQTNNPLNTVNVPPVSTPPTPPAYTPAPVSVPTPAPEHKSSTGSLIAIVVILAVVIVGALYFWMERKAPVEDTTSDESLQSINMQGSSDEAAVIEADLNMTDVDSLDAELNTIE